MLRGLLKTGLAGVLHQTGAERVIGALTGASNLPWVIGYHMVVEDIAAHAGRAIPANLISRRTLERHLDWLGRHYRFISLDELGAQLERGGSFDKPVAAITFDDGYANVYEHAFPLLRRKGIPAGMFLVTDLIGTARLQFYDKLYLLLSRACPRWSSAPRALGRLLADTTMRRPGVENMKTVACDPVTTMRALIAALPHAGISRVVGALEADAPIDEDAFTDLHPMTWEMVSEMQRGGMTIGSHTRTHAFLHKESLERVFDETAASRQVLERRLGANVSHFAYPDGQFHPATVRAVAAAGYRFAYTTCRHRDRLYPLLTIPRTLLWENSCLDAFGRFSPPIMSCQASGVFAFAAPCAQDHTGPGDTAADPAPCIL